MSVKNIEAAVLVADIGGTNTRAALKHHGQRIDHIQKFKNREYADLGALLQHYLDQFEDTQHISAGAICVACAVDGTDTITMTNIDWSFSTDALRKKLGLQHLHVFNDFTAIAFSMPALDDDQRERITDHGESMPNEVVAVVGPGTGLGVSGIAPHGNIWVPLASCEGGHASLPAQTEEESRLLDMLRPRLNDHVSAERLLSGPGLERLYRGLAELRGMEVNHVKAETITTRARDGSDPLAMEVLDIFFSILGSFAGDVALMLGARGGIYLAGGIAPKLIDRLKNSTFRERFEAKGRVRTYLEAIPTWLITDPYPGLTGLGAWVDKQAGYLD